MECKFLRHGISLSYDHVLKPCCEWRYDDSWSEKNHLKIVDISSWHQSRQIKKNIKLIENNQWPDHCISCEKTESQGRADSIRGNGNQAYQHYQEDDITLEIRPGSVCNFACQTCWPEASSRVAQYHHQAGLIDIKNVNSQSIENFDMLLPVSHRIKDVVLLGGEPFYDKSCLRFLNWAADNLSSRLTMFTNGSAIDFDFIEKYPGSLCIVVSLDAIEKPAEYIRFGTEWATVFSNYQKLKKYNNVERRVNVTVSIYNYYYLLDLIELLCQDWPDCVTFGHPRREWFNEFSLPEQHRKCVIDRLSSAIDKVNQTEIEIGQKHNAVNALSAIVNNLQGRRPWIPESTKKFKDFVQKMDFAKKISMQDYCKDLYRIIE
jgi:organic radical activating enzyme